MVSNNIELEDENGWEKFSEITFCGRKVSVKIQLLFLEGKVKEVSKTKNSHLLDL